jgi:hypothetical protein
MYFEMYSIAEHTKCTGNNVYFCVPVLQYYDYTGIVMLVYELVLVLE